MIQLFEDYDILTDRQRVRVTIYPFCSNKKYTFLLDDNMSAEQISESLKKVVEQIDADTGTKKTD